MVGLYNSSNYTIGTVGGLQPWYSWGLYSVCGYPLNDSFTGGCSNTSLAHAFTPFETIIEDTPTRFNTPVTFFISNSEGVETFINSGYFRSITRIAFYLLFLATIMVAVAFLMSASLLIAYRFPNDSVLQRHLSIYCHLCNRHDPNFYLNDLRSRLQHIVVNYDKEGKNHKWRPKCTSAHLNVRTGRI